MAGKVYLVGAGPGDPGLITLKAAGCLARADVVVYDNLANPELLNMAPQAEKIYVGKKAAAHTMAQEEINQLLVALGRQGKQVVRLKGGDPMVFGRGGEEAAALAAAGVDFEVVPGVTSAIAAPAYAGIPVTDRRAASAVAFVTGHEDPTKGGSTIPWQALAHIPTLVVLMGVGNLEAICTQLVAAGRDPATPAAVVERGTTPRQRLVRAPLGELAEAAARAGVRPPAVIVVGEVVEIGRELNWYQNLPLFGKRVLVTRARAQASRLSQGLRELGAEVLEVPTIEIAPPPDPAALEKLARELGTYGWVVFTSANAVEAVFAALKRIGADARAFGGAKVAAIGPATAEALKAKGIKADLTAKTFVAEALAEELVARGVKGKRVVLPRAAKARDVLPRALEQAGAQVDVVAAYTTRPPKDTSEQLAKAVEEGLDVITLTASSTAVNLMELLPAPQRQRLVELAAKDKIVVGAIGPITARAAQQAGLKVHIMPDTYTIPALIQALVEHFSRP